MSPWSTQEFWTGGLWRVLGLVAIGAALFAYFDSISPAPDRQPHQVPISSAGQPAPQ